MTQLNRALIHSFRAREERPRQEEGKRHGQKRSKRMGKNTMLFPMTESTDTAEKSGPNLFKHDSEILTGFKNVA